MAIKIASILNAQKRGVEIGRIRLGAKVSTSNGGQRPSKLAQFRLTSPSKDAIDAAAALLGGEVKKWDAPTGPQWEVYSKADTLDVIIPPGEPIEQAMEMWSGGGCVRRCEGGPDEDGNQPVNQIDNTPCACPTDDAKRIELAARGNACKPTTRLRVMLPTLPGIGVWRVESHGFYAAVELVGRHELLSAAAEKGVYVPARLRLEQRQRGKNQYGVPVLDIGVSVAQIAAGVGVGALPAVVAGRATVAIEAPQRAALPAGGREQPAAQPEEPAGVRAQKAADLARTADLASLRKIGYQAKKEGLMDEFVTITEGQPDIELGDYLNALLEELTPVGAS